MPKIAAAAPHGHDNVTKPPAGFLLGHIKIEQIHRSQIGILQVAGGFQPYAQLQIRRLVLAFIHQPVINRYIRRTDAVVDQPGKNGIFILIQNIGHELSITPAPGRFYHLSGDKAGFSKLFEPVIKKGYSIGIHPASLAFMTTAISSHLRVWRRSPGYSGIPKYIRSCRLSHPHNKTVGSEYSVFRPQITRLRLFVGGRNGRTVPKICLKVTFLGRPVIIAIS